MTDTTNSACHFVAIPPSPAGLQAVDRALYYIDFDYWIEHNIKGAVECCEDADGHPVGFNFANKAEANFFEAAMGADAISQWPEGYLEKASAGEVA